MLKAIGIGAAAMYLFDPQQGRRRRAMLRDQCTHLMHETQRTIDVTRRDMQNRWQGCVAEFQGALHQEPATDEKLVARVRSKLGRAVSHPSAIEVTANNGTITLSGPVLASEVPSLLGCVSTVSGVSSVENHLDVHETAENISALQGGREKSGQTWDIMQSNWSPTTKLAVGSGAAALALYALNRPMLMTGLIGAIGVGLMSGGQDGSSMMQNLTDRLSSGLQGPQGGSGHASAKQGSQGQSESNQGDQGSSTGMESSVSAGQFS